MTAFSPCGAQLIKVALLEQWNTCLNQLYDVDCMQYYYLKEVQRLALGQWFSYYSVIEIDTCSIKFLIPNWYNQYVQYHIVSCNHHLISQSKTHYGNTSFPDNYNLPSSSVRASGHGTNTGSEGEQSASVQCLVVPSVTSTFNIFQKESISLSGINMLGHDGYIHLQDPQE